MLTLTGSCYCAQIKYELILNSAKDARTSLCHCHNCKKAFGTNYGLTTKVPREALKITQGTTKEHAADKREYYSRVRSKTFAIKRLNAS
jgi:hypothetical protein